MPCFHFSFYGKSSQFIRFNCIVFTTCFLLWLPQVSSHPLQASIQKLGKQTCPKFSNFFGLSTSDQGCCLDKTNDECAVELKGDENMVQRVMTLEAVKRKKRNRRRRDIRDASALSKYVSLCHSEVAVIEPVYATSAKTHERVQLLQLPPFYTQQIVVHTCQEQDTPLLRGYCKQHYIWESVYVVVPPQSPSEEVAFKKEWILVGAGCDLAVLLEMMRLNGTYNLGKYLDDPPPGHNLYSSFLKSSYNFSTPEPYHYTVSAPTTSPSNDIPSTPTSYTAGSSTSMRTGQTSPQYVYTSTRAPIPYVTSSKMPGYSGATTASIRQLYSQSPNNTNIGGAYQPAYGAAYQSATNATSTVAPATGGIVTSQTSSAIPYVRTMSTGYASSSPGYITSSMQTSTTTIPTGSSSLGTSAVYVNTTTQGPPPMVTPYSELLSDLNITYPSSYTRSNSGYPILPNDTPSTLTTASTTSETTTPVIVNTTSYTSPTTTTLTTTTTLVTIPTTETTTTPTYTTSTPTPTTTYTTTTPTTTYTTTTPTTTYTTTTPTTTYTTTTPTTTYTTTTPTTTYTTTTPTTTYTTTTPTTTYTTTTPTTTYTTTTPTTTYTTTTPTTTYTTTTPTTTTAGTSPPMTIYSRYTPPPMKNVTLPWYLSTNQPNDIPSSMTPANLVTTPEPVSTMPPPTTQSPIYSRPSNQNYNTTKPSMLNYTSAVSFTVPNDATSSSITTNGTTPATDTSVTTGTPTIPPMTPTVTVPSTLPTLGSTVTMSPSYAGSTSALPYYIPTIPGSNDTTFTAPSISSVQYGMTSPPYTVITTNSTGSPSSYSTSPYTPYSLKNTSAVPTTVSTNYSYPPSALNDIAASGATYNYSSTYSTVASAPYDAITTPTVLPYSSNYSNAPTLPNDAITTPTPPTHSSTYSTVSTVPNDTITTPTVPPYSPLYQTPSPSSNSTDTTASPSGNPPLLVTNNPGVYHMPYFPAYTSVTTKSPNSSASSPAPIYSTTKDPGSYNARSRSGEEQYRGPNPISETSSYNQAGGAPQPSSGVYGQPPHVPRPPPTSPYDNIRRARLAWDPQDGHVSAPYARHEGDLPYQAYDIGMPIYSLRPDDPIQRLKYKDVKRK